MGDKVLKIGTVHQCNCCLGSKTLHPLVSVIDLSKADLSPHTDIKFGFYTILLSECKCEAYAYGHQYCDFSDGTLVCLTPGESISMKENNKEFPSKGWILAFHPDLICGTPLGLNIHNYTFFSYSVSEALHLSDQEKETVMDCLKKISIELEHPIDKHSKSLIAMNIELLLNYCMRFYERQFITRSNANKDALTKFEQLLDEYFQSGLPMQEGLPSVKYFADRIYLSPNYFGDMIKKETGKTPQEHIQTKIIELAKEHILGAEETISEIAYRLGFQYPQHLNRLFKKRVGCTPNEYRLQNS